MIKNANEIKFRASSFGYLMTDAKGQSNKEKYNNAVADLFKYKGEYSAMNPATKTAEKKKIQIQKTNQLILELESVKDEVLLSDTCIKTLLRIYAKERYSRYEELKNKYLTKGNERENDSITVVSRVMKKPFKKNKERKFNEFFQGEWDLDLKENDKIKETLDTKSSWSLLTFLEAANTPLNPLYKYQGHVYMDLVDGEKHTVAHCLVNGTYTAINDEIRRLGWSMGVLDASVETDPEFINKVKQIERNHIFDINAFMNENQGFELKNDFEADYNAGTYTWEFDIPFQDRICTKSFDRDENIILEMKERAKECRSWMNKQLFKI